MESSIFGSYTNLGLIGSGSYGKVYKVEKHSNKHTYAMKKLKLCNIKNYDRRSMLNELKILSSHKCPFLIEYKCTFTEGLYLCIIMQYCDKGTLEKEIKKGIGNDKIWKYFGQITFALNYLHKNQIIYRDLKSSNVLIDNQDNIRLIDFGISKIMNNYVKYTKTSIGTPYYMSPELLSNVHYTFKTDIWSLGILLYEMSQQSVPFKAANINELCFKIKTCKLKFVKNTPKDFIDIITKCLQTSSYKRISLESLLNITQIKNLFILPLIHHPIQFININVPLHTKDWSRILKNMPCRTTPDPVKLTKIVKNVNFLQNYSKNELIILNEKLISQILQKKEQIKALESEIKNLKI